jgi:phenylalanyl-tRNA synthetase beta chain
VKISYNWLKEYINLKEKPQKVADVLTMHAYEVEGVEKIRKDYILDIDILPNRASDSLSHIGVAMELGSLLNRRVNFKYPKVSESTKINVKDYLSVDVKDKKICERYTARVILDVEVKNSPKWLKERLEVLGQNSINNIVDATNYVMLLLGQPMHAFDLDKIEDGKIIIKKASDSEKIETLGGDEYSLDNSILTIRSKSGPLAIAGIKGGLKAELDKSTKNIILESAYFNPIEIRKASKKINLRTESSLRFENKVSPVLCRNALDFTTALILDIAGGKAARGVIDISSLKNEVIKIPFKMSDIKNILGINISDKDILNILKRLNFIIKKTKKSGTFIAEPPIERLDVKIKEDVAEEVARVYGYENINSKPIADELWPAKRNDEYFYSEKARDILMGLGLSDVYNYSFVGRKELNLWDENFSPIGLLNPLSEDKKYLRPTLLLHLLNNVSENLKYQKSVRFFEIGKVFSLFKIEDAKEFRKVSGIISYKKQSGNYEEFYEIKGIIESFLSKFGFDDFSFCDIEIEKRIKFWHSGRSAEIFLDGKKVGIIGEVSHFVLEKMNIKTRVAAFELDFNLIISLADEDLRYSPISKFPASIRDIAILVEGDTKIDKVQSVIENSGGNILVDVDLFDIYEGVDLESELKKSLAFHLVFQSHDKTLSDKEVDEKMKKILLAISKNGWEARV